MYARLYNVSEWISLIFVGVFVDAVVVVVMVVISADRRPVGGSGARSAYRIALFDYCHS